MKTEDPLIGGTAGSPRAGIHISIYLPFSLLSSFAVIHSHSSNSSPSSQFTQSNPIPLTAPFVNYSQWYYNVLTFNV